MFPPTAEKRGERGDGLALNRLQDRAGRSEATPLGSSLACPGMDLWVGEASPLTPLEPLTFLPYRAALLKARVCAAVGRRALRAQRQGVGVWEVPGG